VVRLRLGLFDRDRDRGAAEDKQSSKRDCIFAEHGWVSILPASTMLTLLRVSLRVAE
jgi:hypothetical protein